MLFDDAPPEFLTEEYDTGGFDAAGYLAQNPDVAAHHFYGSRPELHYQNHGRSEGRAYPTIMETRQVANPAYTAYQDELASRVSSEAATPPPRLIPDSEPPVKPTEPLLIPDSEPILFEAPVPPLLTPAAAPPTQDLSTLAAPPEFLTEEYDTGEFDAAAYLEKYPDVARDHWYGSRPAAHYQYHGQREGREYPTLMGTRQVENPAYGEWLETVPLDGSIPGSATGEAANFPDINLNEWFYGVRNPQGVTYGPAAAAQEAEKSDPVFYTLPWRSAIFSGPAAAPPAPYEGESSTGLFDLPASPFASSYDQFGIPIAQSYSQFGTPMTAPLGSTFGHPQTLRMTTTDPAVHQAKAQALQNHAASQFFDDSPNDEDTGDQATAPGMDEQLSPMSMAIAAAIFGAAGLGLPFTVARGYNYFFGEEEPQNMEPFGIDPLGQFGGIGGPPSADDTAEDPEASSAANAAAAAVGFDVEDTEMAAEMSTDDTGGGDSGGSGGGDAPGDPGGGAGADSEASGDPDSDSGDDPEGSAWHLGGLLGGSGPKDITAEGGEYIIRKSAVKKYGRGLFDDLNESKIGKRQLKGLLDA